MTRIAVLDDIRVNGWRNFRALHTTGTRANAPTAHRDGWLTKLWSVSMDALASGLVLLVLASVALFIERREKCRVRAWRRGSASMRAAFCYRVRLDITAPATTRETREGARTRKS